MASHQSLTEVEIEDGIAKRRMVESGMKTSEILSQGTNFFPLLKRTLSKITPKTTSLTASQTLTARIIPAVSFIGSAPVSASAAKVKTMYVVKNDEIRLYIAFCPAKYR